jgi:hypothetical protein
VTISSGSTFTGSDISVTYLEGTITNAGSLVLDSTGDGTEFRPAAPRH